ncbi:hypothetical protein BDN70DRAFT_901704 [Pholiota conissans]|uniref:Uncharacterized protein n=1 Tax=Pholiota conissans TaxID=109636 RepID=A0A9P6CSW3_9AGAR|nr:hypothetical protein BDN70DRAFT_901704 [Pholiota conissans]
MLNVDFKERQLFMISGLGVNIVEPVEMLGTRSKGNKEGEKQGQGRRRRNGKRGEEREKGVKETRARSREGHKGRRQKETLVDRGNIPHPARSSLLSARSKEQG